MNQHQILPAMNYRAPLADTNPLRQSIRSMYHADETDCVDGLLQALNISQSLQIKIQEDAAALVTQIRENNENHGGLDAFLQEFKLSSDEGVALMCLAEALLRVPDGATADRLIQDKLSNKNWSSHLGESDSFFVNASTWGLMLTGKMISFDKPTTQNPADFLGKLIARSGEPAIRLAVRQAMKIMGKQFVLAENIHHGLNVSREKTQKGYRYSYDMLGEAAWTAADAKRYINAYETAIDAIGKSLIKSKSIHPTTAPGISVKLSALHPRYEYAKSQRVMDELLPQLKSLCIKAKQFDIGLTIDAEESERLDPSLSLLQALCNDPTLENWEGLGFVVQAYQKRAPAVLDWIEDLAEKTHRKIMIRLVKGAYWDTEIKHAQVEGYRGYPVFTRKISTDLSYLVCAQKLLNNPATFYPLFATHNAHTVSAILNFAGDRRDFEFQCLHGMGEILYDQVVKQHAVNCRIYAPVGPHKDLLAYLVRRLLENGANSSFVNRLVDKDLPVEHVVRDPVNTVRTLHQKDHPSIPAPSHLFHDRVNSSGLNLDNEMEIKPFFESARRWSQVEYQAAPLVDSTHCSIGDDMLQDEVVVNPSTGLKLGSVSTVLESHLNGVVDSMVNAASNEQHRWNRLGGNARADILIRAADLYQANRDELLTLCMNEAGKTLSDAIAELREAIDFLRYYALLAKKEFCVPEDLASPTGERNQLSLHGRGVFVCISPWNFPLAIFSGQLSAALAAGNAVIAKPAEQTPIIAYRAIQLLHQAGVPTAVLQLLPGDGANTGAKLIEHPQIDGVCFTGSNQTARLIQLSLANKSGSIVPLIAETGGINAMIVDSTALPEQVIRDTISSAFQSAGQRCSALRVLYLQQDVADRMIEMLVGAMAELQVGDVSELDTDIGPIIDQNALDGLQQHINDHKTQGSNVVQGMPVPVSGYFVSPTVIEISDIAELSNEVFGPILHVCRYHSSEIDKVVDDINQQGYGLTFGIHSRVQSTIDRITKQYQSGQCLCQ